MAGFLIYLFVESNKFFNQRELLVDPIGNAKAQGLTGRIQRDIAYTGTADLLHPLGIKADPLIGSYQQEAIKGIVRGIGIVIRTDTGVFQGFADVFIEDIVIGPGDTDQSFMLEILE